MRSRLREVRSRVICVERSLEDWVVEERRVVRWEIRERRGSREMVVSGVGAVVEGWE